MVVVIVDELSGAGLLHLRLGLGLGMVTIGVGVPVGASGIFRVTVVGVVVVGFCLSDANGADVNGGVLGSWSLGDVVGGLVVDVSCIFVVVVGGGVGGMVVGF